MNIHEGKGLLPFITMLSQFFELFCRNLLSGVYQVGKNSYNYA